MNITKDIQPMTTFRNHSAVLLQDAEAYQRLLDIAASVSADEGIRQGLLDKKSGQTRPALQVFGELRAEADLGVE